jgi:hypothetical protein
VQDQRAREDAGGRRENAEIQREIAASKREALESDVPEPDRLAEPPANEDSSPRWS